MTVNYTTNLALAQPVTGTEDGSWGDDVNNGITSYLDIAIAGGLAVSVTTTDVTLTNTQGTSSATNIGSTTAQYAILNVSGAKTGNRNLVVPSTSKWYIVNNAGTSTGGPYTLTVKGSATTGVSLSDGERALVAWNGSDYVKITTLSSGLFATVVPNIVETTTVSATAATGTINYYVNSQSILIYTSNASANWVLNVAFSSGTSLNTALSTGQTVTIVFMAQQGSTAYYPTSLTIDSTSVTPKWQGGTAPTAGNASSLDVYTYSITKTGSATYFVIASQSKFA